MTDPIPHKESFKVGEPVTERLYCPWERFEEHGFFSSLAKTLAAALTHPVAFFKSLDPTRHPARALFYACCVSTAGYLVQNFWLAVFGNMNPMAAGFLSREGLIFTLTILLTPVKAVFYIMIFTVAFHFCLLLIGGARRGFYASLTAASYAASGDAFLVVPILGIFLKIIFNLVLFVVGISALHEVSRLRTVGAFFLLLFLALALIIAAAVGVFIFQCLQIIQTPILRF